MESFFRYIGYIDILEEEKQIKTAGYLIWKYQNKNHNVEIQIKDKSITDTRLEIREEGKNELLGRILMDKGYGEYKETFHEDKLGNIHTNCGKPIKRNEMTGIHAFMEDGRKLYVKIELPKVNEEKDIYENTMNNFPDKEKKSIHNEIKKQSKKIEAIKEESKISSEIMVPVKEECRLSSEKMKPIKEKTVVPPKIMEPMKEEKWEQLCKKFKVVSPFSNSTRFIKLKPEDFVVLQEGYQKLVQNSFLLHGYYQYGHLILGRLEEKEDMPYYIGVPGVYYEREKKAAKMFGFVGFEGAEGIIENGSYGYYMIEVKI